MTPNNEAAAVAVGSIKACLDALRAGQPGQLPAQADVLFSDLTLEEVRHAALTASTIAAYFLARVEDMGGGRADELLEGLGLHVAGGPTQP